MALENNLKEQQEKVIQSNTNNKPIEALNVAQRVVIKIPELKSDKGLSDLSNIKSWDGKNQKGIIFSNETDKTQQGVQVDGTGIIIINSVNPNDAIKINTMIDKLFIDFSKNALKKDDKLPNSIIEYVQNNFLNELNKVISKIRRMDYNDVYNSDTQYLETSLTKMENGLYKRNNRDIVLAFECTQDGFLPTDNGATSRNPEFTQKMSSAAAAYYQDGLSKERLMEIVKERFPEIPEQIMGQEFKKGDFIVKVGDSIRKIDRDVFLSDHTTLDGKEIKIEELTNNGKAPTK